MNDDVLNKVLMKVINIEETVTDTAGRVESLEYTQNKVYDKLDGFLALIQRHESGIAALRATYQRLEQRILRLEHQGA